MKIERFILNILKKIESLKEGIITYSYKTGNDSMTCIWWEISVSDFNFYMNDKRFKTLSNAWHKAAKAQGFKLIFVCGWTPLEKELIDLAEKDNLILNV
jgi:hypothetical protein